jgi:hypothetical protein
VVTAIAKTSHGDEKGYAEVVEVSWSGYDIFWLVVGGHLDTMVEMLRITTDQKE